MNKYFIITYENLKNGFGLITILYKYIFNDIPKKSVFNRLFGSTRLSQEVGSTVATALRFYFI